MVDVMDGPEPKRSRKVRWIFSAGKGIVAGMILLAALVWLSSGTGLSILPQNYQRVYAVFKSAGGLKEGEKVQVAGLEKGKVTALEIKDIVVRVEGKVKLDAETYQKLLSCVELEEPGPKVLSLSSIRLATPVKSETPKKEMRWAVKVTVQSGPGPVYPEANGNLFLNDDNRVPADLRQRLVQTWSEQEFKEAICIAERTMQGDYDTVFADFSKEEGGLHADELAVHAQMPQSMVLCTLDLDNDVQLGAQQPYLLTVQQTAPLIGKPFVSFERSPFGVPISVAKGKEKESVRKEHLLNLGKQEAAGLEDLTKTMKEVMPKIEAVFTDLKDGVKGVRELVEKANHGDGLAAAMLNDPRMRDDLKRAISDLEGVAKKVNDGQGSLGDMVNNHKLHEDLVSATENLNKVLDKVNKGEGSAGKFFNNSELYDSAAEAAKNIREISSKANDPKSGSLLSRVVNDRELGEDVQTSMKSIGEAARNIQNSKGLAGAFLNDEEMKKNFQTFVTDSKEMMEEAKVVVHKVKEGKSALGELAVNEKLGKKVEETINGASETFGAISRTRVFLGGTSKYWGTSKEWVNKGYVRIAPRDSMFIELGGAAITTPNNSPVNGSPGQGSESLFRVDAQLGYKFFDNHLTLRAGVLEGEPGGGVDYDFTVPGWEHDFRATLEARKGYDNSHINEHLGVVVRGEISTEIWKYIRIYAGAGNSTDGVDWMGGITFEWTDDDIKSFVGLATSGIKR